jgi:hypothetical protein
MTAELIFLHDCFDVGVEDCGIGLVQLIIDGEGCCVLDYTADECGHGVWAWLW